MTTTPRAHLPVQETPTSVDAVVAPVPSTVSVRLGTGATPLLPPHHPANTRADSPVVRWIHRLATARPPVDVA